MFIWATWSFVPLYRILLIGVSIAVAFRGCGATALGEADVPRGTRDAKFSVVSDRSEIRNLLARAHSRQASVLKDLRTCKGEAEI
ncbi:MAG: hypothetical protein ACRD6B_06560, partial [Bryobacteraceae bacterium]